jgi:alpha-N-arabinofuranosidase
MANVAQLINCLHSLFLAHGDRFLCTPTYHAFAMYAAHQGGQSLRTLFSAPRVGWKDKDSISQSFWGLNGSASLKEKSLLLTVVNPHVAEPRETEIDLRGATAAAVVSTTLEAKDIHEYNSFDEPERVIPHRREVPLHGGTIVHTFPPATVTKLEIRLR